MSSNQQQSMPPGYVWAPGTVHLEDIDRSRIEGGHKINLFPIPTSNPDDPLNWSRKRKLVNYGIVCSYVLWTFVQLDIGFTAWGPMMDELNMDTFILNASAAVNYGGLAIGCIFFIPFVHKYGRRPLYIISALLQWVSCIWQARVYTNGDLIGSNIISGLGGAIAETVVQITIADLFFVHQHATMNGWYLLVTVIGAFLGPVASGYIVIGQDWRWMWWWCVIFLGIQFFAVIFFFEESKFITTNNQTLSSSRLGTTQTAHTRTDSAAKVIQPHYLSDIKSPATTNTTTTTTNPIEISPSPPPFQPSTTSPPIIDPTIPRKTYRQRLALVTRTPTPILRHLYQPIIILFTFPAIAYCALTFGSILAWFAVMTSIQATYLLLPPYNFSAIGIGLMNLPPFIGAVLGFGVGGWLNDKSILYLSRRNQGVYEPEMRLWMALPCSIFVPAGILIFGIGLAHSTPWIVLAVGYAIFGFGFIVCNDIALAYATDCYQDVIGDALVGIVFVRNVLSVFVLFVLTDWVNGMGVQNLHVLTGCVSFLILLIPAVLIKWGKRARLWTMGSYVRMARRQVTHRTV